MLSFEKLSCSSEILFCYFFLQLHLFDGVHFQYSQVFVILLLFFFFFLSVLILFELGNFIPSNICLFPLFIICTAQFSMPNSNILIIYIYILFALEFPILFHFLWADLYCHNYYYYHHHYFFSLTISHFRTNTLGKGMDPLITSRSHWVNAYLYVTIYI